MSNETNGWDSVENVESQSDYLTLEDGKNKLRIMTVPVTGWERWVDGQPERVRGGKTDAPGSDWSFIWVVSAYDYAAEAPKIWAIHQSTIRGALMGHKDDASWGDPTSYDITVTRSGSGLNTTYQVTPNPKEEFPAFIDPVAVDSIFN